MESDSLPQRPAGKGAALVFVALAVIGLLVYWIHTGGSVGSDAAVKSALKELQAAQAAFRRLDRDGDGYLEYAIRLHDLHHNGAGSGPELIARALADACDESASGDFFGHRFRAMKGLTVDGGKKAYATAPDGNGTLDGFTIGAFPVDTRRHGHRAYFISEAGDPWSVLVSGEREKAMFAEYPPERR